MVLIRQMSTSLRDATFYNKAIYSQKTDLVLIWARHSAWLFFHNRYRSWISTVV